jgi:hypothetical protein
VRIAAAYGGAVLAKVRDDAADATVGLGRRLLQGRDFSNVTFNIGQAAAAPVALAQLPTLVSGFTGRKAELTQMAGLLDPAAAAGAVVVSAVAGLAGVGKTALAIQAGHAARAAGWFPGGVLFIDLHGCDDAPVQPGQALDSLLRALGVPAELSRRGRRTGLGCTGRCWRRSPIRCW